MTSQPKNKVTFEELRTVIANVMDIDENTLKDEARFIEELGMDSLMALEIMVTLEKQYGVKLNEDELRQLTCMKAVHELLDKKLSEGVSK